MPDQQGGHPGGASILVRERPPPLPSAENSILLGSLGHISGPNRPEPQRAARPRAILEKRIQCVTATIVVGVLTIQVSLDHAPESNSETYPGVTASWLRLVPPHASFHGQHQGDAVGAQPARQLTPRSFWPVSRAKCATTRVGLAQAQVIPDSWSSSSHCCQYSGGATRQH
ncbi:hypothetical protein BM1_05988 [Bipolaris maydis]|nr:hypothetical protein BM1_05988 [Bipolaris maydis]